MSDKDAYDEALREWGKKDLPPAAPSPCIPPGHNCPCIYCSGNRKYAADEEKKHESE
jgi:hypothetical protein